MLYCAHSYPTLYDSMDCSPSGSFVHGIFQVEYWSGSPFPTPGDLSNPGIKPMSPVSPALVSRFVTTEPPVVTHNFFLALRNLFPC